MSIRIAVLASASVLALGVTAAQARPLTLREALALGFEIKATTFIAQPDIARAMNNTQWGDDVMLTLQRGEQVAFCHMLASSTTDIEGSADTIQCSYTLDPTLSEPQPPASSSEEPSVAPSPSSELPMSSAATSSSAQ